MIEAERVQRLADINRRLRENASELAALEQRWQGNLPLDAENQRAALREEAMDLRVERQRLVAEAPPELIRRPLHEEISDMWMIVSQLDLDTRERWRNDRREREDRQRAINRAFVGLTVWLTLLTAGVWNLWVLVSVGAVR